MEKIIKAGMEATFLNTLAFLSFQSSQTNSEKEQGCYALPPSNMGSRDE
jgi:hypothetical protein